MLIRNARVEGYSGLVDLRLMNGCVREIGVGLVKGLYEAEMDIGGDELRPLTEDVQLEQAAHRRWARLARQPGPVAPGAKEPLVRCLEGKMVGLIHSRSGD